MRGSISLGARQGGQRAWGVYLEAFPRTICQVVAGALSSAANLAVVLAMMKSVNLIARRHVRSRPHFIACLLTTSATTKQTTKRHLDLSSITSAKSDYFSSAEFDEEFQEQTFVRKRLLRRRLLDPIIN
jgi:hypothetical protein